MFEIVNMRQMLDVLEVRSDMMAMVQSSAQMNPSKFQKVTKYALFYSSVIFLKISRVILLLQQLASMLDI